MHQLPSITQSWTSSGAATSADTEAAAQQLLMSIRRWAKGGVSTLPSISACVVVLMYVVTMYIYVYS